jgi:mevalonate kinase
MILGQKEDHDSWVKCVTSAEGIEIDISTVLIVKSGLGSSFY